MLEKMVIEHCAPTLAGLKTGDLFNYNFEDYQNAQESIRQLSGLLNKRGIYLEVLFEREKSLLIYVYRENKLSSDLSCPMIREFLENQGYNSTDIKTALALLKRRIASNITKTGFPHEIGVFLSYPLQDVKGFIENAGSNCKHCGYWKVYQDEDKAINLFRKFDKCKQVYHHLCGQGSDIVKLTVAS
ncbi:DUF3793 family protein [Clostridium aminobutyricum]|uniref:DUF3793 family protein n=1 Tax=Clostridium aminobutyricum TaxID=33953 RepID=A0A939D956_CLOAM|nr:DUF3793 family protein [Clostridium aminobutyricum]MBN7773415.1 DUF3793 family protein [Clostridium aminobutyricum]